MTSKTIRIPVNLQKNPYEVIIESEAHKAIGIHLEKLGVKKRTKILTVSNPDVADSYSKDFIYSLRESGFIADILVIDAGEDQKNLSTIEKIHDSAYEKKLERGSLMIALGGGVVGDMTGFAAATWLRGIGIVQVPTTLLSMVDASIGGKTGVNHPKGKNLIGAFHQPNIVLIDPLTLKTLPEREFRAGMAEVIKYGMIGDKDLFKLLESIKDTSSLQAISEDNLIEILTRSVTSKAKIVALDEREGGVRAILNYGHTFGHVIENLCGYGKILHGEAVAIGMATIAKLSMLRNELSAESLLRQDTLIKKTGLPTKWPHLNTSDVLRSLQGDKKVNEGLIRFIMPKEIGEVDIVKNVSNDEIIKLLSEI